jgi:hypothetical protein
MVLTCQRIQITEAGERCEVGATKEERTVGEHIFNYLEGKEIGRLNKRK